MRRRIGRNSYFRQKGAHFDVFLLENREPQTYDQKKTRVAGTFSYLKLLQRGLKM